MGYAGSTRPASWTFRPALDTPRPRPDIAGVSAHSNLPALGLSQHFAREAQALALRPDQTPAEAVGAVRRVLDRTAAHYARSTDDPALQRAGQWLVEIVKSGTGLVDRASHAEVVWDEVAVRQDWRLGTRDSLFYAGAGLVGLAGLLQGAGLAVWGTLGLAGLHALTRVSVRIPFLPRPRAVGDAQGRMRRATAVVRLDPDGLVRQVGDALSTADHILARLAAPRADSHWRDDARLVGLLQSLVEAGRAGDEAFALELSTRELPSLLEGAGLSMVDYDAARAEWFDRLPALGEGPRLETAAPALVSDDGRVVRRGTVWVRER